MSVKSLTNIRTDTIIRNISVWIHPKGYNEWEKTMKLLEHRESKEISREELAKKIGISVISIGRYERGERRPTVDILPRYAAALGCSIDELLEAMLDRVGA